MANAFYTPFLESLLSGDAPDFDSDTIDALLVDTTSYTFSAAHEFLASIDSEDRIASVEITGKSVTNGVFDGNDVQFSSAPAAGACAIVLYKDTGNAATSQLVCYLDTGTGLPVTPSGGDVDVVWGANIFSVS